MLLLPTAFALSNISATVARLTGHRALQAPNCANSSIAVTVTGQPSIAVGFVDIRAPAELPLMVATLEMADGTIAANFVLDCGAEGLILKREESNGDSTTLQLSHGKAHELRASDEEPLHAYSRLAALVDIQYAFAPFPMDDRLIGQMNLYAEGHSDYTFLQEKMGWQKGSTVSELEATVLQMKRATGACPMLRRGYSRLDDLGGSRLLSEVQKRRR